MLEACDGVDGTQDGVLEDPRRCDFDPMDVSCPSAQVTGCLTAAQAAGARRVYAGLKDPNTGEQLYPAILPGSERFWAGPFNPTSESPASAHFRWLVFADSAWDWRSFDFTDPSDYAAFRTSEARVGPIVNAMSPDLSAFRDRGGKLLQYHGWSDQMISPLSSIDYFESVAAHFGVDPTDIRDGRRGSLGRRARRRADESDAERRAG